MLGMLCQHWQFIQAHFLKVFFKHQFVLLLPSLPWAAGVQSERRIYFLPQEKVAGTGGTGFPDSWHPALRPCSWGGLGAAPGDGGGR